MPRKTKTSRTPSVSAGPNSASGVPPLFAAQQTPIPVIDLFAGPGGLGEGFSALGRPEGRAPFKIRLSIEKDLIAHQTLELRSFFRHFPHGEVPEEYYHFLQRKITRQGLLSLYMAEAQAARNEAWHCELSDSTALNVSARIKAVLGGADPWVLIGGPPCQAYSLAGRSRNSGKEGYVAEDDPRQNLYVEYLQVIANHWPAVFVMENVKGLLSATLQNQRIFERIVDDLQDPRKALSREGRANGAKGTHHRYTLHSLNADGTLADYGNAMLQNYLIRAERHGVPQARHRLILVGVRDDITNKPAALPVMGQVPVWKVLEGLPALRSGLSKTDDSADAWINVIRGGLGRRWLKSSAQAGSAELEDLLTATMQRIRAPDADRGGEFIPCEAAVRYERDWFLDPKIGGVCNHRTRGHMEKDLFRYLYAACYGQVFGTSPDLSDLPPDLLPDHANVQMAIDEGGYFGDRFRVQLRNRPSTTITSHISKDGHYYVHYDPGQCRSLTVREAGRLQTFPDNYFFCGERTAQYTQVGNAVPPLLAREIARIVSEVLC